MAVLQPEEYNASYFDGATQPLKHNAGYSKYQRWYRTTADGTQGEFWKDAAEKWAKKLALPNKKFLELGSAKGFLVEDLREQGVDAYGLDVSQYAYDEASDVVKPFLTVGDARTALSKYDNNEFDVLFSARFIECISEEDLPALVSEMNRISKLQVHVVDDFTGHKSSAAAYYTSHTQQEWLDKYEWDKGTLIVANEDLTKILTK
jgi:cyclopropane fatty-acyl-phospholipid synthase-like methyltransferase